MQSILAIMCMHLLLYATYTTMYGSIKFSIYHIILLQWSLAYTPQMYGKDRTIAWEAWVDFISSHVHKLKDNRILSPKLKIYLVTLMLFVYLNHR
jgi:hypothetical protein